MRLVRRVNRRGRPRLQRYCIDSGTQELQRKRQELVKSESRQDQPLAESLLGVLYARQLISRPLYEAGCFFKKIAWDYQPCLGSVFRRSSHSLFLRYGSSHREDFPLSEEEERKRVEAWRKALNVLYTAGKEPYRVVLEVIFYEGDLYTDFTLTGLPKREIAFLREGLEQLDVYFTEAFRDDVNSLVGRVLNRFQATTSQPSSVESPPSSPQESGKRVYRGL